MELFYRISADLLLTVHTGYALFVVFGLVATLLGAARGWSWVRNFWFRTIHLLCIAVVVAEVLLGIECPLTTWENQLRERAGETTYEGGFIADQMNDLLFYEFEPWVFGVAYTLFGLVVLATFFVVPPRRPNRKSRDKSPPAATRPE